MSDDRPRDRERSPSLWASGRRQVVEWLLLAHAVFHLVTNGYYLRFLEPFLSKNALTAAIVALAVAVVGWNRAQSASFRAIGLWMRRHWIHGALVAVIGVGFFLRLGGIEYGLPQSYNSDEYDFVHSYLQMLKRGDFNPRWWIHPSVQAYVNAATYLAVFLSQVSSGRWQSVHELSVEDMLYWGRFGAGVLPGTIVVLLTFILGRRMFGPYIGLGAATLIAVFPGAVEWSQYNKPDPLLALMIPISVIAILKYFDDGGTKLAVACGIAIGLTAAAKYNGGFVVLTFLLALAIRHGSRSLQRPDLYACAGGTVAGFFLGCPYWFADFPRFIDHVANALYNYGYAGWPGAMGSDNWYFHAHYAVTYGTGPLAFVAAIIGLGVVLYRLDQTRAIFLSFPVLYYAYYSSQLINIPGNMICIYPFVAILAVVGLRFLATSLARIGAFRAYRGVLEPTAVMVLFLVALAVPTRTAIAHNIEWNRIDTGNIARLWIEANIAPNAHIARERQTPFVDPTRYRVTMESRLITRSVQDYRANGVEYLIVSSAQYDRFGPEHRQTLAYAKLFAICPLVKEFAPTEGRTIGPTIRILQVPAES